MSTSTLTLAGTPGPARPRTGGAARDRLALAEQRCGNLLRAVQAALAASRSTR